jgi:hypothetical protein
MKYHIRRYTLNLFLGVGLLLVLGTTSTSQAQSGVSFELGGQILGFLHPAEMHTAGMKWLKMQITWARGGSTGDAQNVIGHARRNGFKVLLSIKGLKHELAANPTQYYQDFAGFLAQVALLNPEGIEVWNEPNIDQEWPVGQISGTNYAQMLARAYPAIKQANPNVLVISGAPAPTGYFGGGCAANGCDDKIFIEQMKAAGATSNFDCTGIHYNEGVVPPSASSGDPRGNPTHYTRYYPTMVSTYRTVFPTKPLCFTEIGYISPDGLGGLPAGLEWGLNTSAQEQAQWLAQAATISRDSGIVRLMIVWNVDATFIPSNTFAGWAIIRTNGQCLPCASLSGTVLSGPLDAPITHYSATSTIRLSWEGVTWASGYRIEVDNNPNFNSPTKYTTIVGANIFELVTPSLPTGIHYWRVQAKRADGSWAGWTAPQPFQIDMP